MTHDVQNTTAEAVTQSCIRVSEMYGSHAVANRPDSLEPRTRVVARK